MWRHLANTDVEDFGVSEATAYPLMVIGRLGDGLRQSELADALGIEGPSLVRLLDQLAGGQLVERRGDTMDRRAKTLHLTPQGAALARQLAARLEATRHRVFAGVADDEIRAALKVFAALERACRSEAASGETVP